jgi:hypothetical protein
MSKPNPGVICEQCGAQLALETGRTAALVGLTYLWFLAVPVFWGGPSEKRFSTLTLLAIAPALLARLFGPGLYGVRLKGPDEKLVFTADPMQALDESLEPLRQQAAGEEQEEDARVAEINAPTRKSWLCSRCKTENPATFDMCWNCSALK